MPEQSLTNTYIFSIRLITIFLVLGTLDNATQHPWHLQTSCSSEPCYILFLLLWVSFPSPPSQHPFYNLQNQADTRWTDPFFRLRWGTTYLGKFLVKTQIDLCSSSQVLAVLALEFLSHWCCHCLRIPLLKITKALWVKRVLFFY